MLWHVLVLLCSTVEGVNVLNLTMVWLIAAALDAFERDAAL